MAFDPTSTPRMMKMVAGFHSLPLSALACARAAASAGSVGRRKGLGISELQNDGVAIRGRCDSGSWAYRDAGVVVNCLRNTWRLAHAAHKLESGAIALDGAMS